MAAVERETGGSEWSFASVRETLAVVGIIPALTVLLILTIVGLANGLGLPDYACVSIGAWTSILAPILLGAVPLFCSLLLALRKGPIRIQLEGLLVATELVIPLAIQIIVLQMLFLAWARQILPALLESPLFSAALISLAWPLVFYVAVVLYAYISKSRIVVRLEERGASSSWVSQVPSAVWGIVVTATALIATGLQAPQWSGVYDSPTWVPFFLAECIAAIAMSLLVAVTTIAFRARGTT